MLQSIFVVASSFLCHNILPSYKRFEYERRKTKIFVWLFEDFLYCDNCQVAKYAFILSNRCLSIFAVLTRIARECKHTFITEQQDPLIELNRATNSLLYSLSNSACIKLLVPPIDGDSGLFFLFQISWRTYFTRLFPLVNSFRTQRIWIANGIDWITSMHLYIFFW